MNPSLKRAWIEALRSGKYIQGTGHLCQQIGRQKHYCCLGVLCELLPDVRMVDESGAAESGDALAYVFPLSQGTAVDDADIPNEYVDKIGLTRADNATLIDLNDTAGQDFNSIADYIERWVEEDN